MQVQVAFSKTALELEVPDALHCQVLNSAAGQPLPDPIAAVEAALDHPAAGPPLASMAHGKRSAAISVCDITRPAPNPLVLPPLLRKLETAGIPRENISILIATGLHRAATEAEIGQIVGPETARQYRVLNHDARRRDRHRHLGRTRSGTPVWIDERFIRADLHLTLGFIEPHLMLGFSGGRKLIAPGLAAQETITELHSPRFMRDPRAVEGSVEDNPLHAELLEIASMARHDFLVDVALTRDRRISAVFAGEPRAAHRAGFEWVRSSQLQVLDEPVDAVITSGGGYPLDLTFYQSIKGITAGAHIVRPGGRILLIGACEEGLGGAEFQEMMMKYSSDAECLRGIERAPVVIDQLQLEKLALVTREKEVLYYLPGVPAESHRHIWGRVFSNPDDAVSALFEGLGRAARIAVIPEGPYVLANLCMAPAGRT